ncbi:NETI motif-containing protein [Staphylococcus auricularis]|uniref:NETI motif-containing protein n=1 Tax=Staphylococcus auricularis TaxID=29379 RepID=UPI003EBB5A76
MKKQQKFRVEADETIQDCLARMREAGYMPVKRFEKPVYQELKDGSVEVLRQEIEFVGKRILDSE